MKDEGYRGKMEFKTGRSFKRSQSYQDIGLKNLIKFNLWTPVYRGAITKRRVDLKVALCWSPCELCGDLGYVR